MGVPLRILIVEDSADDVMLLLRELRNAGYDPVVRQVNTSHAMESALDEEAWDAVVAAHRMPLFSATGALMVLRQRGLDLPFIVVFSSKIDEGIATAFTKAGAHDYVTKDSLARLGPAIERKMHDAEDRRERRRAEKALEEFREIEDRFRATFDQVAVGMSHVGLEGRLLRVNRKFCDIIGYTSEELLGLTFQDITHPDDLKTDLGYVRQLLAGEIQTYSIEKRYIHKHGAPVWIYLTVSLVRRPSGEPGYFIAVVEDISERKRTQEALRQSEVLYRTVVEQAAANIFLVDAETEHILEANATLHRSLGYTDEEIRRMTLKDILARDQEVVDPDVRNALKEGSFVVGERLFCCKDGSLLDVEVSLSSVSYDGRDALCIAAHDVTERKRAEESLRRSLSVLLALREAGQILGSTLEAEEIVSRLLEIMQSVSSLTATVISVLGEDGELRIWRSVGLEGLWQRARYAPEAEAARRAALENGEYHLFLLQRPDSGSGQLAGLCLPLRTREHAIGVLEAYGPGSLAESDTVEILSSLASQAASALENARLYAELGEREQRLQDLVGKLLGAQEEERRLVSYEVHDGLAQVAVAAHQHLQAFSRRHPPNTERSRRDLERVLRLVRRTVSDARKIIANLRPTTLDDFGLAATISLEVDRLREEGYRVDYEEELGEERLSALAEIALFRVTQEALTNIRKHAQTRRVRIELRRQENNVRLEVRDHGRGFDPTAASAGSGPGERVGLAGMRERIGMLGGKLEIHSRPGGGTSIVVEVPSLATKPEASISTGLP